MRIPWAVVKTPDLSAPKTRCSLNNAAVTWNTLTEQEDILAQCPSGLRELFNDRGRERVLALHNVAFDWGCNGDTLSKGYIQGIAT